MSILCVMSKAEETKSLDFHMRISPPDLAILDRRRKREPDLPTRAEMMRRLIRGDAEVRK